MTAEHAHGIDTGGEVEAVLRKRTYDWLDSTSEVYASQSGRDVWVRGLVGYLMNGPGSLADLPTRASAAADTVLAEARRLCCGENPAAHHAASAKHSELMAFAGDLARAVRGL